MVAMLALLMTLNCGPSWGAHYWWGRTCLLLDLAQKLLRGLTAGCAQSCQRLPPLAWLGRATRYAFSLTLTQTLKMR
jgi:hypothetical protein